MFQPWFVELVSVISDIVVGLSAIVVAILAFWGLRQWKIELTGRTKFETAKKLASLAFEYRDRYKRARSMFTSPGEYIGREKGENETPEERDVLDQWYARQKRLAPLQETLRKLYETGWEAEIIIDKDISKHIKPFEAAFAELYTSIEAYFGAEYTRVRKQIPADRREDWLNVHYHRIYGKVDDDVSVEINNSTQSLVDSVAGHLK